MCFTSFKHDGGAPLKVTSISSDLARANSMVIKKMVNHALRLRKRAGKQRDPDLHRLAETLPESIFNMLVGVLFLYGCS